MSTKNQLKSEAEQAASGKQKQDARPKAPAPLFIGRWTPKILFSLQARPYRHAELRRNVGNVSQRMLTRTLRNLESTGLITRRMARSRAMAAEYALTKIGRTIIAPLRGMCRWAKRYRKQVSAGVYVSETPGSL